MRVLVVKLSSLGDVIHALPALTDAAAQLPGVRFDWAVEESLAQIPAWHPAVERVIPVALRRWRRKPLQALRGPEWRRMRDALVARPYDAVVDAQGLIKSAVISRLARGPRWGMDGRSAREGIAATLYSQRVAVPRDLHAVERIRLLFARTLGYPRPETAANFGIEGAAARQVLAPPQLVFCHGSARAEKLWPVEYWSELARLAVSAGCRVCLPWGSAVERERAQWLAATDGDVIEVMPRLDLAGLARRLQQAAAVVAVDTGPGHLAAALGVPGVSLYASTSPQRVGTLGPGQVHLVAHDGAMTGIAPGRVWAALEPLLAAEHR